jgi:hypothetical protein
MGIRAAWREVLKAPGKLPKGVSVVLKGAQVDFGGEALIRIAVQPGLGLERLNEPGTLKALRSAVAQHTGSMPEIRIEEAHGPGGRESRITEDTVRKGRLQELVDEEPALGDAVKELDLELLD